MASKSVKCTQAQTYGTQVLDPAAAVYAVIGPTTLYWYSSPAVAQATDPNWRTAPVVDCTAKGYKVQPPINVGTYTSPFNVDGLSGTYGCAGTVQYSVSLSNFGLNTGIMYPNRNFICMPTNGGVQKVCYFFLPTDVLPPTSRIGDIVQAAGCQLG